MSGWWKGLEEERAAILYHTIVVLLQEKRHVRVKEMMECGCLGAYIKSASILCLLSEVTQGRGQLIMV